MRRRSGLLILNKNEIDISFNKRDVLKFKRDATNYENLPRFQHVLETKNDASSQPESSASSTSSNDTPDYKMNAFFKRMSQSNEPALGTDIHHLLADYGNKKLSANKGEFQSKFGVFNFYVSQILSKC